MPKTSRQPSGQSSQERNPAQVIGTSVAYATGVACWQVLSALGTLGSAMIQGFQAARNEE